jgi:DNA-binding MarR family transcriptional regulator
MPASTPPRSQPQGCTNLKLRQFMRRMSQYYDSELAQVGLRTTQYSLLSYLDKLGPVRPGELAAGLKMDASTLTRNLRPLVDAGWAVVEAGENARSRLVRLTPAGREKRAEAKRRWKVAQEGINRLLGVEQVVALHALIDASMDKLDPVEIAGDSDG